MSWGACERARDGARGGRERGRGRVRGRARGRALMQTASGPDVPNHFPQQGRAPHGACRRTPHCRHPHKKTGQQGGGTQAPRKGQAEPMVMPNVMTTHRIGRDMNSGWYCTPKKNGWSSSSRISMRSPSVSCPVKWSPRGAKCSTFWGLTSYLQVKEEDKGGEKDANRVIQFGWEQRSENVFLWASRSDRHMVQWGAGGLRHAY